MVIPISGRIPIRPVCLPPLNVRPRRALEYMGLKPGMTPDQIKIDRVFIGSCTNSVLKICAAATAKGHRVAQGSGHGARFPRKEQAEAEGCATSFFAGFEARAGCSMCLAVKPDVLQPGERCASTSIATEGRQGN